MNILTDVLSLIRRGVFSNTAELDDVLVLGKWNETPDMTGVASPIPYKSIKVIRVRDFKVATEHCDHINSPAIPPAGTGQVYQKTDVDAITQKCTVFFRSLKSMSSNLTLATSADDDYVEITTEGEPNLAANVGTGQPVWKDKVGETLNFRSLVGGTNVTITQSNNEVTINSATGGIVTSLTTTGTSGASTLSGGILNIPNYATGGGSGEVNTASNVGSGTGVFAQKTGVDLEFKTLKSSDGSVVFTSTGTEIDLTAESSQVKSALCSGKAWMKYLSGSDGGAAMTGVNYKLLGSSDFTHGGGTTTVYSPHTLDWTTSSRFTNSGTLSWVLPADAVWSGIPIGQSLSTGDTIAIDCIITNTTTGLPQVFNVMVGWFDCADTNPWPVTIRDVNTGNAFLGVINGRLQGCTRVTSTLTADTVSTAFVTFGFNFPNAVNEDEYNISWTLVINKAV